MKEAAEIRTPDMLVPKAMVAQLNDKECGKKCGLEAGTQEGSAVETMPIVTPCGELEGAEPSAASSVLCSKSGRISKGTLFLESSQWWRKAPRMSSLQSWRELFSQSSAGSRGQLRL